MIPVMNGWGKRSFSLLFAVFCLTCTALAQNATNGGNIQILGTNIQTICPGETPALITSVNPASGGDPTAGIEYLWMYGSSLPFSNSNFSIAPGINDGETYQPGPIGSTTYFIRCARRTGWTAFQAESNIVTVNVTGSPTAMIIGAPSNLYNGGTVDVSAFNQPNTTYTWDMNGNGFANCFGENCSFTYTTPGTYTITLTATNALTGCVTTTSTTVVVTAASEANIMDPCDCGNAANLFTPTAYYNNDYILINSNAGETWFFNNTGGTTLFNSALQPIPNGTVIPEIQPGVYFLNVWFIANAGWTATATNTNGYTLSTGPVTLPANCVPCTNPLPVQLKDFRATAVDGGIMLKWNTESEENNSHFEVESSIDASRFDYHGKVEGAGNSTSSLSYSYFVENPVPGDNYFRLRQVDFDGQNEFSNTVSIRINAEDPILAVVPNPVNEKAIIRLGDTMTPGTKLELVTATGQLVKTINITSTSQEMNMADLPAGIYFLRVEDAPRSAAAYYKIVKQ